MVKTYAIQPAITVILTDYETAVLFTVWMKKDIGEELAEHFSNDARVALFACPRSEADIYLGDWPCYPGPVSGRRHIVPFGEVAHILRENEQDNGQLLGN